MISFLNAQADASVNGFTSQDSPGLSGLCNPEFALPSALLGVLLMLQCPSLESGRKDKMSLEAGLLMV